MEVYKSKSQIAYWIATLFVWLIETISFNHIRALKIADGYKLSWWWASFFKHGKYGQWRDLRGSKFWPWTYIIYPTFRVVHGHYQFNWKKWSYSMNKWHVIHSDLSHNFIPALRKFLWWALCFKQVKVKI